MKIKPTVTCHRVGIFVPRVGQSCCVRPFNHPGPLVSNTKTILTSPVVRITHTGFETENTIYVFEKVKNNEPSN